ncbi:site-specific integrase [Aeromicrobium flavum]|uniref:Site-specific integrase n=1 Tax=Aeromicrobium flavum TaxID=416568 RepID=A0A512HRX1_9ACTN|nr:tyrosine-type recombinase/integrase [Aeromicrobium flavum]GEO88198.1 site-specific integrase [Aeromicrobium flavum]
MASIKKREIPKSDGSTTIRWRARYRDRRGEMHEKLFAREREAKDWIATQTASVVTGKHVAPRDGSVTLSNYAEHWLTRYRPEAPSSVASARVHVHKIQGAPFASKGIVDVEPVDVEDWLADLADEGRAPSYIAAVHARLRSIYKYAIDRERIIHHNPAAAVKGRGGRRREYTLCSPEQMWAIHEHAETDSVKIGILLGAFAGLRVGEIVGLRPEDCFVLDPSSAYVYPRQQFGGAPLKTPGSAARVEIPSEFATTLRRHIESRPSDSLLVNQWGKPLQQVVFSKSFQRARDKAIAVEVEAGVPVGQRIPTNLRAHDLRHLCASMLFAAGRPVPEVAEHLRHASSAVTLAVYSHMIPGRGRAGADALSSSWRSA